VKVKRKNTNTHLRSTRARLQGLGCWRKEHGQKFKGVFWDSYDGPLAVQFSVKFLAAVAERIKKRRKKKIFFGGGVKALWNGRAREWM